MSVAAVVKVRNCNGCGRNSNILTMAEVKREMVDIVACLSCKACTLVM